MCYCLTSFLSGATEYEEGGWQDGEDTVGKWKEDLEGISWKGAAALLQPNLGA